MFLNGDEHESRSGSRPTASEGHEGMSRLRERLFASYDRSYLRGNALEAAAVGPALGERYVAEYEAEFGTLARRIPVGTPVVDLGCGIGLLLYWLQTAHAGRFSTIGVEISEPQLALAQRLGANAELRQGEASAFLRNGSRQFGAIFCTDLLEHLESEDAVLELVELARAALVPTGLFICRVPNMANLTGAHIRYIDLTHSRGFTAASLVQLLDCAGFHQTWIEPRRHADYRQKVRLGFESAVHRMLFRLCGVGDEKHFGRTIVGVGRA